MYINSTGYYIPEGRVGNDHFLKVNGLTSEWIVQRTGIETRSKCGEGENVDTMALEAVEDALRNLPYMSCRGLTRWPALRWSIALRPALPS